MALLPPRPASLGRTAITLAAPTVKAAQNAFPFPKRRACSRPWLHTSRSTGLDLMRTTISTAGGRASGGRAPPPHLSLACPKARRREAGRKGTEVGGRRRQVETALHRVVAQY